MIVVIFIGLGRAYKFGGRDFEVILWGEAPDRWGNFYGGSSLLKTPCSGLRLFTCTKKLLKIFPISKNAG